MTKMRRRSFLKMLALGAAAVSAKRASGANKRPNIILFLTDDQDKESIGAYGGNALTPNLDRMAREGMLFHQAYVSSTVCTPSRYTFLTGRYAGRSYSGMYREACPAGAQGFPTFNVELEDDNMNVGAVLQKSGYTTGYVGKFHVGPEIKRPDEYEGFGLEYIPKDSKDRKTVSEAFRKNELWYREYLKKKGFSWAKNVYWGNLQNPFNNHNPEWTIDAALEFIDDNKDGPFYLHYCTTLVHGPDSSWRKSMDHPQDSGEGILDEPLKVMTDRKELLRRLEEKGLDPYAGHAGYTWVDDSVGAILKKLDEHGIADNTLIVFTADHGSNMKASLFKVDGTNVPCIMRWPGGIKAGVECNELIQNIDYAPTFFDLAGATVPKEYIIDGKSVKPLFGGKKPKDWRDHLYFEMGAGRAVCTKEWKYISVRHTKEQIEKIKNSSLESLPANMAYITRSGIGVRASVNPNFFEPDQLYNLERDGLELKNLAGNPEYQEILDKLRGMLTRDLESFDRPFGEFVPGGNASPPGQIDKQVELVKQLKIQGKKVIVPEGLVVDKKDGSSEQGQKSTQSSGAPSREEKVQARQARRDKNRAEEKQ